MWVESLLDRLTCFVPRPIIIRLDEGGFRQTPKPWNGWPWSYWPWFRFGWIFSGEDPLENIQKTGAWHTIYCPILPKGKPWASRDDKYSTWITELLPGNWYWYVPLFMENAVVPTKTDIKDVRIQSVWTKDGKDVAIGVSIRYYVSNPMNAILDVRDYDESLQNIVLGVVSEYVENHTVEELRNSRGMLVEKLLKAVRGEASGWGLKIQSVKITDIGRTQNFRILMDDKVGIKPLG